MDFVSCIQLWCRAEWVDWLYKMFWSIIWWSFSFEIEIAYWLLVFKIEIIKKHIQNSHTKILFVCVCVRTLYSFKYTIHMASLIQTSNNSHFPSLCAAMIPVILDEFHINIIHFKYCFGTKINYLNIFFVAFFSFLWTPYWSYQNSTMVEYYVFSHKLTDNSDTKWFEISLLS